MLKLRKGAMGSSKDVILAFQGRENLFAVQLYSSAVELWDTFLVAAT